MQYTLIQNVDGHDISRPLKTPETQLYCYFSCPTRQLSIRWPIQCFPDVLSAKFQKGAIIIIDRSKWVELYDLELCIVNKRNETRKLKAHSQLWQMLI